MMRLTLPMPPTSNHNTTVANGRRISSKKYRTWRVVAEASLRSQTFGLFFGGPYAIVYTVERPDRRRRDVENIPKSISDALQAAGVIADDANCIRSTVQWAGPDPVKGAVVHVEIEPA